MRGKHEDWYWVEYEDRSSGDMFIALESLILGKCLALNCLDSGPMRISQSMVDEGWREVDGMAVLAHLNDIELIPRSEWSEWYFFQDLQRLEHRMMTVVNFEKFTLGNAAPELPESSWLSQIQSDFWTSIILNDPYLVVLEGTRLSVISRDKKVMELIDSQESNFFQSPRDAA